MDEYKDQKHDEPSSYSEQEYTAGDTEFFETTQIPELENYSIGDTFNLVLDVEVVGIRKCEGGLRYELKVDDGTVKSASKDNKVEEISTEKKGVKSLFKSKNDKL